MTQVHHVQPHSHQNALYQAHIVLFCLRRTCTKPTWNLHESCTEPARILHRTYTQHAAPLLSGHGNMACLVSITQILSTRRPQLRLAPSPARRVCARGREVAQQGPDAKTPFDEIPARWTQSDLRGRAAIHGLPDCRRPSGTRRRQFTAHCPLPRLASPPAPGIMPHAHIR
jgi:hypothetical protein